ncbi:unnamed protein product [Gordionus sp. m RMFG-2023]
MFHRLDEVKERYILGQSIEGGSGLVNEKIILPGDLNMHMGASSEGYERAHGGFSGMRNPEGNFGDAMDMIVRNTIFKKESEKLVTCK